MIRIIVSEERLQVLYINEILSYSKQQYVFFICFKSTTGHTLLLMSNFLSGFMTFNDPPLTSMTSHQVLLSTPTLPLGQK